MARRRVGFLFVSMLAFLISTLSLAQEKTGDNMGTEGRCEGNVVRTNPEKSTLTVRDVNANVERTIHYDGATRWVSQARGSKKVNEIDARQVKDNDRVIVRGIWDHGVLYATLISKRLSHSQ
jgi:hypothetical protein